MSNNLYWKPVIPQQRLTLPDELKRIFARAYWESDGSLYCEPRRLTQDEIPYLLGIRDASSTDLARVLDGLIAQIRKHSAVEIWIAE